MAKRNGVIPKKQGATTATQSLASARMQNGGRSETQTESKVGPTQAQSTAVAVAPTSKRRKTSDRQHVQGLSDAGPGTAPAAAALTIRPPCNGNIDMEASANGIGSEGSLFEPTIPGPMGAGAMPVSTGAGEMSGAVRLWISR